MKILQSHPVVISPVLRCIIGTDVLSNWQNLHIGFLTYGMRAIMVEKTKRKPLELLLPSKIVNQKQYHIPGGMAEINATIIDKKKKAELVIFTTPSFSSLYLACVKNR